MPGAPFNLANSDELLDEDSGQESILFDELSRLCARDKRTGEYLIEDGSINNDQLRIALLEQKKTRKLLGDTLIDLGFINEEKRTFALAKRAGLSAIDLEQTQIDPEMFDIFNKQKVLDTLTLPLFIKDNTLHVAMADPFDILASDEVRRHFPRGILIQHYVTNKQAIEDFIGEINRHGFSFEEILAELESSTPHTSHRTQTDLHPVVRLVNFLLYDATRRHASDIHLEPEENYVRVRYRLDGVLHEVRSLHLMHWPALSHRIKIISNMNIADTRNIQDGRFQMKIDRSDVDFRVAIMPTVWGETIVLRILDHTRSLLPLEELGYSAEARSRLELIAAKPQGITLVTGPTGSGKTTTLYSVLQKLSTKEVHIATLEEPVEFQLDLIRQTSIQDNQALDFAAGVRGLLRMDPDIIFIGEIRDPDTAQMALRAAMTGHQVYSTLHCNDVFGALPRLIDLGLNYRLLAGNISGLIAQRLVRKLCPHCKTLHRPNASQRSLLGIQQEGPSFMIAQARGCASCSHTGRYGRTVIAEILPITPALNDLVARDAPRSEIEAVARDEGFVSMQEDGIARVLSHEICLEDLCRAVDMTSILSAFNEAP